MEKMLNQNTDEKIKKIDCRYFFTPLCRVPSPKKAQSKTARGRNFFKGGGGHEYALFYPT